MKNNRVCYLVLRILNAQISFTGIVKVPESSGVAKEATRVIVRQQSSKKAAFIVISVAYLNLSV